VSVAVLHLISSRSLFGAERVVLSLCKELIKLNVPVYLGVIDAFSERNALVDEAVNEGIEVLKLVSKWPLDFSARRYLVDFIKDNRISVVHSHNYKANFFAWSSRLGVPWVVTEHTWGGKDLKAMFYEALDKRVVCFADAVVGVSENLLDDFRKAFIPSAKCMVIYNGIELMPSDGVAGLPCVSSDVFTFGFIGRWSVEKNVLYLLDVFARLVRDSDKGFLLRIAGKGPLEGLLRDKIINLGISRFVELVGFVSPDNVQSFYSSLDCLVLPSKKEGLPMVVLEALAMGRPVAGSFQAVRAVRDDVAVRQMPIDNISDAAWVLQRLSEDVRQDPDGFFSRSRALVENGFSATKMARDYLELYKRFSA